MWMIAPLALVRIHGGEAAVAPSSTAKLYH